MIIAVDFDGTLAYGVYPSCGKPNTRLIDWLVERKERGDRVILWTCREGKPLADAVSWCKTHGLYFDAINENLPEMKAKWGDSRKVGADYYIDDTHFTSEYLMKKIAKAEEPRVKKALIGR